MEDLNQRGVSRSNSKHQLKRKGFYENIIFCKYDTDKFISQCSGKRKRYPFQLDKGGVFTLLFNQASFSNWIAGGENSVSGTVSINYDFNYKNGDWSWDNKIITKYGLSNISGAGTRKTDDSFEFNSLLGKKAGDNWSYSLLLNIRSQFTDGFDYATSPKSVTSKLKEALLLVT